MSLWSSFGDLAIGQRHLGDLGQAVSFGIGLVPARFSFFDQLLHGRLLFGGEYLGGGAASGLLCFGHLHFSLKSPDHSRGPTMQLPAEIVKAQT